MWKRTTTYILKSTRIQLTAILTLVMVSIGYAQFEERIDNPCGTDAYLEILKTNPQFKQDFDEAEFRIRQFLEKKHILLSLQSNDSIRTIPVVVHVIHNGGTENISDLQIQSQLDVLNEDFRKRLGSLGDGKGIDTRIEFCLAKKDAFGRCTDGIVRIRSPLTNHLPSQRGSLRDLSFWNPEKYLNIYIVKSISGGVLGYSSFPGGPPDADGIVIKHSAFGRTGTVVKPNNLGRTTTHEISHWFGLYHTFTGGCGNDSCQEGDKICDTPPVASPNYGCPKGVNSCHTDIPDLPDQIENYTDYTDDSCKNMFTRGQKQRMHATLATVRPQIWSANNLYATGCLMKDTSQSMCPVIADFTTLVKSVCKDAKIQFIDKSQNKPTQWHWTFPGGSPSESFEENPLITYSSIGEFEVSLMSYNFISKDSLLIKRFISVSEPSQGRSGPFGEGFEEVNFPPNGIIVDNPDSGVTWHRTTLASIEGSASVVINNLINTNYGQSDALILPALDLTQFSTPLTLQFKWAYARSNPTYSDELSIMISTDCGVNFTNVFSRSGNSLATAPVQDSPFVPSNTQWRSGTINLAPYFSYRNVIIKIVNVTDGGNNLYIDSITIGGFVFQNVAPAIKQLPDNLITIFPSPITGRRFVAILLNPNFFRPKNISITDIQGKTVLTPPFEIEGDKIQLVVDKLIPGIYFVRISDTQRAILKKIVVEW